MLALNVILTTALFWSLAQGISLKSSWSAIEGPVQSQQVPNVNETVNYRLPDDVIPNSYRIRIIPDMDSQNFSFSGESEINIDVKKPTRTIILHAKYLNIDDSIQLKCHPENSSQTSTFNVSSISMDNMTDFLTISLEEELLVGSNCNLTLGYSSTNENSRVGLGFYESSYSENGTSKRMASTQFEAIYARRAFPCWDEPGFKANFIISIKHNTKYGVLSNMHADRCEKDPLDNSQAITYFAETPKMSTYTVAFAIGDFETVIDNDVGYFRVWSRKSIRHNGKYMQEVGPKVLDMLENYFNFTYESHGFKKMDILAVPKLGSAAAMENWGLITWQESAYFRQSIMGPESEKENIVDLMAHELAHQWFGNLATFSWWDYTWLSEGFATYFAVMCTDQFEPKWRSWDRFVVEALQGNAFQTDRTTLTREAMDHQIVGAIEYKSILSTINYDKAASIIRMISHVIGEELFQSRLRNYLQTFAFKSAKTDDLLQILADGNEGLFYFMQSWTHLRGYPVITITRNYGKENARIIQSRHLEDDYTGSVERYYIPMNYVIEDKLDFNDTTPTHWFYPFYNVIEINELPRDKFVIFNKQQFGYYRVNYDERNWRMIAKYLRTKNHTDIHVINRAQLIDDAFHLANVNQLKYNVALSLIGYLKEETDFVVWSAAWRSLNDLYNYVENTEYATQFKDYFIHLSKKAVGQVLSDHLNQSSYDMEMRKNVMLAGLWTLGSDTGVSLAAKELETWLSDSEADPQIPLPALWIICGGGRIANQKFMEKLWKNFLDDNEEYHFFYAMKCTFDADIWKKYLSEVVVNSVTDNPAEHFGYFINLLHGKTVDVIQDFMLEHHGEIIALKGYSNETTLANDLFKLAGKLITENQFNKLDKFFESVGDYLADIRNNILEYARMRIEIFEDRSREFKEFFGKDIFYDSLHTELKMNNKRMEYSLSIDFNDIGY